MPENPSHGPQPRHGRDVLENFLLRIAGASGTWTPAAVVEDAVARIRAQVGDDRVLCVNNLSGHAQAAELDLSDYEGKFPVELLGRERFPRIGELPYLLTFGPHAFYWFELVDDA